jgi:hypothetical protein
MTKVSSTNVSEGKLREAGPLGDFITVKVHADQLREVLTAFIDRLGANNQQRQWDYEYWPWLEALDKAKPGRVSFYVTNPSPISPEGKSHEAELCERVAELEEAAFKHLEEALSGLGNRSFEIIKRDLFAARREFQELLAEMRAAFLLSDPPDAERDDGGVLPIAALSADCEDIHVLRVRFQRPVTSQDRANLIEARNALFRERKKAPDPGPSVVERVFPHPRSEEWDDINAEAARRMRQSLPTVMTDMTQAHTFEYWVARVCVERAIAALTPPTRT